MPLLFGPEISHGVFACISSETGCASVAKRILGAEAQRLRAVPRHAHVVCFLGEIERHGARYLHTELLEMSSLANVVRTFGPLPEPLVANFTAQALLGLHHLHQCGMIHGDVKAANLLLSKEGVVKLCDFAPPGAGGLASAAWLAPEVARGEPPTAAADLWALGITVLELLAGAPPFAELPAASAVFAIGSARSGPPLPSGLSPQAFAFLAAALERDAARRGPAATLLRVQWVGDTVARLQRCGAPHSARLGGAVAAAVEEASGGRGGGGGGRGGRGGGRGGGGGSGSGGSSSASNGSGSRDSSDDSPRLQEGGAVLGGCRSPLRATRASGPSLVPRLLLPAPQVQRPVKRGREEWLREWRPLR